jgi:hypothetical protein
MMIVYAPVRGWGYTGGARVQGAYNQPCVVVHPDADSNWGEDKLRFWFSGLAESAGFLIPQLHAGASPRDLGHGQHVQG